MQCISLVTYAIRINGKLSEPFTLLQGLRQGDPLSPYLFLLCAEGLSALIKNAVSEGNMEGGPSISHLFFADDSIIFCKTTIEECDALQQVLNTYEQALGQQLNRAKTLFFPSPNIVESIQEWIKSRFGA